MKTLIVGCGLKPKPGATNLDKFPLKGVNLVFDLDRIEEGFEQSEKLPFQHQHFDRIDCSDILEHVNNVVAVFNELARVLKIGGQIFIRGPHWKWLEALWDDPTHKRAFTERTFAGWIENTFDYREYGHYFHQGKCAFKQIGGYVERNKGLELTLERIK